MPSSFDVTLHLYSLWLSLFAILRYRTRLSLCSRSLSLCTLYFLCLSLSFALYLSGHLSYQFSVTFVSLPWACLSGGGGIQFACPEQHCRQSEMKRLILNKRQRLYIIRGISRGGTKEEDGFNLYDARAAYRTPMICYRIESLMMTPHARTNAQHQ